MKKYIVRLSKEERESLKTLASSGKGPARMFSRERILLKADAGAGGPAWPDEKIAEALDITVQTVERVRKQLVEEGLEAVLRRCKYTQKVSRKKLDGDAGAISLLWPVVRRPRDIPGGACDYSPAGW